MQKQVMRSSGRSTSPCAKTSSPSPQGVAELDAERLEEERLEAAQREAEQVSSSEHTGKMVLDRKLC